MARTPALHALTTFRIGGTPVHYYRPRTLEDLRAALDDCRRRRLPWRPLGGGSNVLVDEGPLPFAVIHVLRPGFARFDRLGPDLVRVGAGMLTARLLARCRRDGLGGLEFLAGLPGTVGGAVRGNAGAWGSETADVLARVQLVHPDGAAEWRPGASLRRGYRCMDVGGAIVTAVELNVRPCAPEQVRRIADEYLRRRTERQPGGAPSAGCIFRNPEGDSAGRLLDLCGLKGRRAGDAEVSDRHANFILNRGQATASDVLALIGTMRQAVRSRFRLELEMEVEHWAGEPIAA